MIMAPQIRMLMQILVAKSQILGPNGEGLASQAHYS